ncbi:MAG: hypothetical protein EOO36_10805 [Cytophagaceae bacterium]|nr:MAG: hypothetical protein EOO36_10805 [Cytophagaceae bacterium]
MPSVAQRLLQHLGSLGLR